MRVPGLAGATALSPSSRSVGGHADTPKLWHRRDSLSGHPRERDLLFLSAASPPIPPQAHCLSVLWMSSWAETCRFLTEPLTH